MVRLMRCECEKKTDWVLPGGMAFNLSVELALTAAAKDFPG